MASRSEMLKTTLGDTTYRALSVLAGSESPMSGRGVASALGVSPTTATDLLSKLRNAGLATAGKHGKAHLWRLDTDNDDVRVWLKEQRDDTATARGMSPYPTGAGGVTFERKVATHYLAHLLLHDGGTELGDGRFVVRVDFQQAPEHAVDDLVVHAARVDESEPSLVLAIAVRRSPDLVHSDPDTRKLIRAFVKEIIQTPTDGPELRLALVAAGPQPHAQQLATLAGFAANQIEASKFFPSSRRRTSSLVRFRDVSLNSKSSYAAL